MDKLNIEIDLYLEATGDHICTVLGKISFPGVADNISYLMEKANDVAQLGFALSEPEQQASGEWLWRFAKYVFSDAEVSNWRNAGWIINYPG